MRRKTWIGRTGRIRNGNSEKPVILLNTSDWKTGVSEEVGEEDSCGVWVGDGRLSADSKGTPTSREVRRSYPPYRHIRSNFELIIRETQHMKPEVAFYYPGQYWINADWIKNLVLFFDGIGMLIPEYMEDYGTFDDYPIISSLKDHGLFHVIRPEENVGAKETKALAEAFAEIIDTGRLDQLTKASDKGVERTNFGSLSMSRLGYYGDEKLADSIFQELKARGLADDSEDGVSIPMHRMVRTLILVLLAQILRPRGDDMGLTLSPVTDQRTLVEALNEVYSNPNAPSPSIGDIVSFDMAMVGVDLGGVPVDEILDFRRQNYSQHRGYSLLVRKFARELSLMPPEERETAFEQRQEELDVAASALRKLNRMAWKKPISFGISLAGAAWNLQSGNPIGAAIATVGAVVGTLPDKRDEGSVYSYILSAGRSLH